MKLRDFNRFVSKCEVTVTSEIVHVRLGWKAPMEQHVKEAIHKALDILGTPQYDPRPPMPVIEDYKEALTRLGDWGRRTE